MYACMYYVLFVIIYKILLYYGYRLTNWYTNTYAHIDCFLLFELKRLQSLHITLLWLYKQNDFPVKSVLGIRPLGLQNTGVSHKCTGMYIHSVFLSITIL